MSEDFGFDIKIKIHKGEGLIGPGIMQFLDQIEQNGSMQKACIEMGMAYSKGWKILKLAESALGAPLLIRTTGGNKGGGSQLTEEAIRLIADYRRFVDEVKVSAAESFDRIFGDRADNSVFKRN